MCLEKAQLRKIFQEKRKGFSYREIYQHSSMITQRLSVMDIFQYKYYHLFLPIENKREIQTLPIQNLLIGKKIITSKVNLITCQLSHYLIDKNTEFAVNNWGIPEPVNAKSVKEHLIEVVFIPLLCFDKRGHRVGYGKGFL